MRVNVLFCISFYFFEGGMERGKLSDLLPLAPLLSRVSMHTGKYYSLYDLEVVTSDLFNEEY